MADFPIKVTDETLNKAGSGGAWMDLGVHEVTITAVERGVTPNTGSIYIEFTVENVAEEQGKARLYLTEKTVDRTIAILSALAVHSKGDDEAERQKVREAFKKITNTSQLDDKFLSRFVNMLAWVDVYEGDQVNPNNGRPYKQTDIFHYKPKHRTSKTERVAEFMQAEVTTADEILEDVPFGND